MQWVETEYTSKFRKVLMQQALQAIYLIANITEKCLPLALARACINPTHACRPSGQPYKPEVRLILGSE